jgi:hypothetical protein
VTSFGTSVGSRALTMRQAIIIAAVCEILGAASLGSAVSNSLVQKISSSRTACWNCNVGMDSDQRSQDMFWGAAPSNRSPPSHRDRETHQVRVSVGGFVCTGMLCAMVAGSIFLLGATHKAMPVSTTHAVVGAVLGMSLLSVGPQCVLWGWDGLIPIVLSWSIPIRLEVKPLAVLAQRAARRGTDRGVALLAVRQVHFADARGRAVGDDSLRPQAVRASGLPAVYAYHTAVRLIA